MPGWRKRHCPRLRNRRGRRARASMTGGRREETARRGRSAGGNGRIRARPSRLEGSRATCAGDRFCRRGIVLPNARHVQSPFLFFIHPLRFGIHETIHGVLASPRPHVSIFIFPHEASHTCSPPSTSSLAFVMTSQGISSGKSPTTFGTNVGSFASMQFGVPFQVMEPPESGLASLADVRFLLAVRKKMALEVVVSRELGRAVGTSMLFGEGRSWAALMQPRIGEAQVAARIAHADGGHWVREGFVRIFRYVVRLVRLVLGPGSVAILGRCLLDRAGTGHG